MMSLLGPLPWLCQPYHHEIISNSREQREGRRGGHNILCEH